MKSKAMKRIGNLYERIMAVETLNTYQQRPQRAGDISAAVFPRQNRSSRYNEHSRTNMGFGVHDGHVFLHQK